MVINNGDEEWLWRRWRAWAHLENTHGDSGDETNDVVVGDLAGPPYKIRRVLLMVASLKAHRKHTDGYYDDTDDAYGDELASPW